MTNLETFLLRSGLDSVSLEAVRSVLYALNVIRNECGGYGRIIIDVTPEKVNEVELSATFRARTLSTITHPPE